MLGVPGTGPYGKMRELAEEIRSIKYDLEWAAELGISKAGQKRLGEALVEKRLEMRKLRASLKKGGPRNAVPKGKP